MNTVLRVNRGMMWIVIALMLMVSVRIAWAQEGPVIADAPDAIKFDLKGILGLVVHTLLPAITIAFGPIAVAFITKGSNSLASKYIPREVQVMLSGVLTAALAGLTGDVSGAATAVVTVGSGLGAGLVTQTLAATQPSTLLTEAPKG